jgi:hypothetical protein
MNIAAMHPAVSQTSWRPEAHLKSLTVAAVMTN